MGWGGEWKNDFWAIFFAALIGLQIYFSGHLPCKFFYSNYFSEGEGGGGIGAICVSP